MHKLTNANFLNRPKMTSSQVKANGLVTLTCVSTKICRPEIVASRCSLKLDSYRTEYSTAVLLE